MNAGGGAGPGPERRGADRILSAYNRLTREVGHEHDTVPLEVISGTVPKEIAGVLYRNGPGRMHVGGVPYRHLFDGDGMVQRFWFEDGRVYYTNRFVRTAEFEAEEKAGRPLYRSFGTNLPGGLLRNAGRFHFKNAANTHVLPLDGEILALWEGGQPHSLDAATLKTRGPWRGSGLLEPRHGVEKLMGNGRPFAAHYKIHPATGEIYNFALLPGSTQHLVRYRLPAVAPPADMSRGESAETKLPRLSFMHDFVLTEAGDMVFFDIPVSFRLFASFAGLASPVASIVEDPSRPTIIRIFDKEGRQTTAEAPPCYVFHFPNGHRAQDGSLSVYACRMEHFPSAGDVAGMMQGSLPDGGFSAFLTRFDIDVQSGAVREERVSDYPMELPSIHPDLRGKAGRYVWAIADKPERLPDTLLHGIGKFDLATGETLFADRYPCIVGEPLFQPTRPGRFRAAAEDDGVLLVLKLNVEEERSELEILDAGDLSSLCTLALPEPVHVGFHGVFVPAG